MIHILEACLRSWLSNSLRVLSVDLIGLDAGPVQREHYAQILRQVLGDEWFEAADREALTEELREELLMAEQRRVRGFKDVACRNAGDIKGDTVRYINYIILIILYTTF